MSGISPKQGAQIVKAYKEVVMLEIEKRCRAYCNELCLKAIEARQAAPGKHNFTGNLLNSIVTCVYREQKPVYACYAGDSLPEPIQVKMTYPKNYYFRSDYEGAETHFKPDVKTNEGWGQDDAVRFFHEYKVKGNAIFTIVVAYPVEYADFVEKLRHTTGILATYAEAQKIARTYLCINN